MERDKIPWVAIKLREDLTLRVGTVVYISYNCTHGELGERFVN